jgi:hypothetical protein
MMGAIRAKNVTASLKIILLLADTIAE